MDISTFLDKAQKSGLQRVASPIASSVMDCMKMISDRKEDRSLPVSASKLGGDPDLPQGFVWPSWKDTKLEFLLQVNLLELRDTPVSPALPGSGLLSFFYHPDQITWGFDPQDLGSWRTYYFPDGTSLVSTETPDLNSEFRQGPYPACSVTFKPAASFPNPFSALIDSLKLSDEEFDAYADLYDSMLTNQPQHQLFGHPNNIQNPMEIECELVTNGVYLGDAKWTQLPDLDHHREKSKDWRLLLQLDSDENASMMWGDVGMLYFWIRKGSLLAGQLEQTWMIAQCS